jgi:hypothetical protein
MHQISSIYVVFLTNLKALSKNGREALWQETRGIYIFLFSLCPLGMRVDFESRESEARKISNMEAASRITEFLKILIIFEQVETVKPKLLNNL